MDNAKLYEAGWEGRKGGIFLSGMGEVKFLFC